MTLMRLSILGAALALSLSAVAPAYAQYTSGPLVLDRFITKKTPAKKPAVKRQTEELAAKPADPNVEQETKTPSPFGEFQTGTGVETTGLRAPNDPSAPRIREMRVRVVTPEEFNEIDGAADAAAKDTPTVVASNEYNEIDQAADRAKATAAAAKQTVGRKTDLAEMRSMPQTPADYTKSWMLVLYAALGAALVAACAGLLFSMRRAPRVRLRME